MLDWLTSKKQRNISTNFEKTGIVTLIDKLIKLNPRVDFLNLINRINSLHGELPVNFYHGSYFDVTNIAILKDILDGRTYPKWLQNKEIQFLAMQALSGVFLHTDVGHAKQGLQEMAQKDQPQRIRFCSDASLRDMDKGRVDSPFYVFKECLYDTDIYRNGATVTVQPIRVFDGGETYLLEKEIDHTGYFGNGYYEKLITAGEPRAFLITLEFPGKLRFDFHHFENERFYQLHKECRPEEFERLFGITHIILFEFSTHILARILKESRIDVFSLYEANDADSSGTLSDSMPEPLCNAKYIISGRGCVFESGHGKDYRYDYPHVVKDAYFRFNGYSFLGMTGKLESGEKNNWGSDWNSKYFHGLHSPHYIYGVPSMRLIFKKADTSVNPLENTEIKEKYDALKSYQIEAEKLEAKIKNLEPQIPWLLLTELPRIHLMRLIKNEKHLLQIETQWLRIESHLKIFALVNKSPSMKTLAEEERSKLANALYGYMSLIKEKNRPKWLTEYVDIVKRLNYCKNRIGTLMSWLDPILKFIEK
jgi:hypothetical protein